MRTPNYMLGVIPAARVVETAQEVNGGARSWEPPDTSALR
jgi:hypothetical protein